MSLDHLTHRMNSLLIRPFIKHGSVSQSPVRVFISHAAQDADLCETLVTHLAPLCSSNLTQVWHQRQVLAGSQLDAESAKALGDADIILVLISADALADATLHDREIGPALARHNAGARVVPVIVRAATWEESPLKGLQPLPRDGRPVTLWPNPDAAWQDITQGVLSLARSLRPGSKRHRWHWGLPTAVALGVVVTALLGWRQVRPRHILDRTEVTNQAFASWLNTISDLSPIDVFQEVRVKGQLYAELNAHDGGVKWDEKRRRFVSEVGATDRPVVAVTWLGASAYCRAQGKRLPTESEWLEAARHDAMATKMAAHVAEWTADQFSAGEELQRPSRRVILGGRTAGSEASPRRGVREDQGADDLSFRCLQDQYVF